MTGRSPLGRGLAGSMLVAVAGFGAGSVPTSLATWWLPGSSSGRVLSTAVSMAGVALLVWSWWALRSEESERVVLRATVLWSAPLLFTVPLFSRDLYAYAGQARLVLVGLDPYTHGPADVPGPLAAQVDDVWAGSPSPYGPLFLRLAGGVVALTGERPLLAVWGLRLLAVLGMVLIAWALPRLARAHGVAPARALWLGLANPLLLLHGVAGGHNDVLMIGLLMAGLAVAPRVALGAVLITLATLVKVPAIAGLAFLPLLAEHRLRATAVVAATAVSTAVGVTLASGLGWGWLSTLSGGTSRRSLMSVTTALGVATGAEQVAQLIGLALGVAAAGYLLLRAQRWGPVRALGVALLVVVVLGPVVHPWYLIWGTVVLAAVASGRLVAALAVGSAVLCLLILPSGRHVVRSPFYGVSLLLTGAAAVAASRDDRRLPALRAGS